MIEIPARYEPGPRKSGGMSSVIKCNDTWLQRPVMVKHLDDPADQARLLDEIQALQAVRSAYVVQIYDVITDATGDVVGVIEEYCPGDELSAYIGKITYEQFIKFGYQLITGIAEVHEQNIIHRDIKPHNVIVGSLNRLTIIDFGLARATDGAKTVSAIGTSGFMAPELFLPDKNGNIAFSPAIDVFAFASSMFLLGVGALPKSLCKRPPDLTPGLPDLAKLPFSIDDRLKAALGQAHSFDARKRPSARELSAEFLRVLVHGKHRALLNISNNPRYLDNANPRANASIPGLASITIVYDGDRFVAQNVKGDLFVNAGRVTDGFVFPGSCVIAFGAPELTYKRQYITFDVSHPGVTF